VVEAGRDMWSRQDGICGRDRTGYVVGAEPTEERNSWPVVARKPVVRLR